MERRGRAEGYAVDVRTYRTLSQADVSQRLDRVRARARYGKEKFTALMHHITVAVLDAAFGWLERNAAAGTDGVRWTDYARHREANLIDLHARLHRGA